MNDELVFDESMDLRVYIAALFRHTFLIIIIMILFGAAGYFATNNFLVPKYQADAMMIVNSRDESKNYLTRDSLESASSLVGTYKVIILSNDVMESVFQYVNFTGDKEKIKVDVSSVDDTQVMRISVVSDSPYTSWKICKGITEVIPDILINIVEAGSVKLVSSAKVLEDPVSPSVKKNTVLSAMIGFVLVCGILFLQVKIDKKLKRQDDIIKMNLHIIGVVPGYRRKRR